jgi:DNA helicase TIP49 (TBP-interacting protein)
VPPDLLDRLLIIPTKMYAPDEVRQIVAMRAQAERVSIDDRALDRLADIGADCSLR